MSFHEVRFPDQISYGSRGGPGFATSIIETESGHEQRVARWQQARRRYNVSYGLRDLEDIRDVQKFYVARRGALNGFRYKDWFDFTSADDGESAPADDDQVIDEGDGSETEFQLVKNYESGNQTHIRRITKPVAGTVVVAVDGTPQTPSTDFTVDPATGIITFVSAPANGDEITAGFEFDVPVRFAKEMDDLFSASYDAFESGSIPDIPLVEILDPLPVPDDWWLGGATEWETEGAINQVTVANGRLQLIDVQDSDHALRLPDPTNLPLGGPYFYLVETGTNNAADIEDEGGSDIGSLPADGSVEILLGPSGWVVV